MLRRRTDRDQPQTQEIDSAKQAMKSAINDLRMGIDKLEVLVDNPDGNSTEVRQYCKLIGLDVRRLAVLAGSWQ